MSSDDIVIRSFTDDDADFISEAFVKYFKAFEPISCGWAKKHEKNNLKMSTPVVPHYNKQLSIVAVSPKNGNKQVGFLLNNVHTPETVDILEKEGEKLTGAQQVIRRLFCTFYRRSDIYNLYGIDKAFHLDQLTVDPEYRGRQIGFKLVEYGLNMAKKLGYKVAFIEASSCYTSKIAQKLGMECLVDIPYKDYRDENGKQIVDPDPPHTNGRFWVKVL